MAGHLVRLVRWSVGVPFPSDDEADVVLFAVTIIVGTVIVGAMVLS